MRIGKSKKYLTIYLLMQLFMMGCKRERIDQNDDASLLFDESAQVIIEYTDKIRAAQDSLSVDSLSEAFEKRIIDINFSFPGDTDLKLSEQDNDSLYSLLQTYLNVKKEVYRNLAISPVDSLESEVNP